MPNYEQSRIMFIDDAGEYDDPYPAIREVLSADYADASAETIEQLVESSYPGMSADDLEGFFSTLSRAGRSIGRVAQRALPGVVQGATAGAALGPWGMLAGGLAGGAISAATSSSRSRPRSQPRPRMPHRPAPRPAAPIRPTSSPAAVQLLRTLSRPEVMQALSSLVMGSAGQRNVNIGGQNVPVGAITNLLSHLLESTESELHASTAGESMGAPAYLLDDAGEFVVDPADSEQRAERVLQLFEHADSLEDAFEDSDEEIDFDADSEWDEYDDQDEDDSEEEGISLYEGMDYDALNDDDFY